MRLFLTLLLAAPAFGMELENTIEPYRAERKATFELMLRRAKTRYPDCFAKAAELGPQLVPVLYAYTPYDADKHHYVYEIRTDKGDPAGTLELAARKHPMMKMLSLRGCVASPR